MADKIVFELGIVANSVDVELDRIQKRIAELASKPLKMPGADFSQVQNKLNNMDKAGQAQILGQNPQLKSVLDQYAKIGSAATKAAGGGPATLDPGNMKQLDIQLSKQLFSQKQKDLQISQQMYAQNVRMSSLLANMLLGGGTSGARRYLANSILQAGSQAIASGSGSAASGGSLTPGLIQQAVTALVSSGALEAIAGVASVALPLAAVAGVGFALNNWGANQATQAQELYANTGNDGNAMYETAALHIPQYRYGQSEIDQSYANLGEMGVNKNQIVDVSNNAQAFARVSGLDLKTTTQMAGTLSTAGRLNPQQIGQFFDALDQGSKTIGISLTRMIDVFGAFQKATGQVSMTLTGQESLMALQKTFGAQGINVGSLTANMANASGMDALKLAGFIGETPEQLQAQQEGKQGSGGLAKTFQLYGQALRKALGGYSPNSATGQDIMEIVNSQFAGGLNLQGLSVSQQSSVLGQLASNPSAAYQEYLKLQKTLHPSENQLQSQGQNIASVETPVLSKISGDVSSLVDTYVPQIIGWLAQQTGIMADGTVKGVEQIISGAGNVLGWAGGTLFGGSSGGAGAASDPTTLGFTQNPGVNKTAAGIAMQIANGMNLPYAAVLPWVQQEGTWKTHPENNNPLNLSDANGDTYKGESFGYWSNGKGSTSIAKFDTLADAISAYAQNLQSPDYGYPAILKAARTGNPMDTIKAIEASSWAPGQYTTALETLFKQDFTQQAYQNNVKIDLTMADNLKTMGIQAHITQSQAKVPPRTPKGHRPIVKNTPRGLIGNIGSGIT